MNYKEVIREIEFIRKFKTETSMLEVKSAGDGFPRKCYDTISSFSNTNGGIIIFGINEENNFEVEDVYDIKDLQKQIAALCSDCMEPVVRPIFLPIEFEGKKMLAVKIEEMLQNKKPCYYKPRGLNRGAYIRVGDRDEVMTAYEIYALESYNDGVREDLRINNRASIDDLNSDELSNYVKKIKEEKINFSKSSNDKILKLSGIMDASGDNIYPTIAGTMIFGEYPQAFYLQLFIACTVIPGTELGDVGEMGWVNVLMIIDE